MVRVIEETVQDGVAEGGIANDIVPVLDGDLAGEQRATAGIAVVKDLEEVVSSLAGERSEPPVIKDEEPRPGEPLDELGIRPVPPGEGEFVEQAGDAVVAGGDAEAAGLVAERTDQIGFSRPGRTGDEHGLAVPDPLPGGEAEHEGSVQSAWGLEVEVFDGHVEVELGVTLQGRERDIHRIVDVFNGQRETPGYARMVPLAETASETNDYNLNIPRYIDPREREDLHDLGASVRIPQQRLGFPGTGPSGVRRGTRGGLRVHLGMQEVDQGVPNIPQTLSAESPERVAWRLLATTLLSDMNAEIAAAEYTAQKATQITQKTTRDRILDHT